MFKNLKIVAVLCVLLLAVVAAGCSGKNDALPTNSEGEKQAEQPGSQNSATGGDAANLADLMAKGKAIKGMYFENEFTIEGTDEKMNTKTWIKGTKVRSEVVAIENMGAMITLVDTDKAEAFMYMPDQNMATRLDLSGVQEGSKDPRESFDAGDMKYLGRETLEGEKCAVYEILDNDKTAVGKLWLWEKHGVPLRMESRENGHKVVMVYQNYQFEDWDDTLFTLPADVQIMDMQMPQLTPKK